MRLALPSYCSLGGVPLWLKNFNSLSFYILFITLHKTLVRVIGGYFEGFVGSVPGFDIGITADSSHFQGSILAAIFCCTEQGESSILLVEGVSTFNCGSYPGQEKSFWWLG